MKNRLSIEKKNSGKKKGDEKKPLSETLTSVRREALLWGAKL
jgi:hypothetical protein